MSLEDIMKDITDGNKSGTDSDGKNQDGNTRSHKDGEEKKEEKTFTQDEVNEIVSKRLAKQKDSLLKSIEDGQRGQELDERERKLNERELKADVIDRLTAEGLSQSLAPLISCDSREACDESYKQVTEIFRAVIGEERKTRARQSTPMEGAGGNRGSDPIRSAFNGKR